MILSDKEIRDKVRSGEIVVEPFDERNVQPASLDLRLGRGFLEMKSGWEVGKEAEYEKVGDEEVIIEPKGFVLATTEEYIKLPKHITAFLEGRSSIGRIGLFIHNAGWIDPGFEGNITLELFNASSHPIRVKAGMRICQVVFSLLSSPSSGYNGKYRGQSGVTGSRIHLDRW